LTLFDLLFLAIFIATAVVLIYAAYCSLRGRIAQAGKVVVGAAIFWAVYLAVVIVVSFATPRRVLAIGERRCFDDWCLTVQSVDDGRPFKVTLRVYSDAKRVTQSAPDNKVFLEDDSGKRYAAGPENGQPPFSKMIGPGESYDTIREFDVPAGVKIVGLVVGHSGVGPGAIVIGDDDAIFHKPAIVKF
jgi:hypothetical protein